MRASISASIYGDDGCTLRRDGFLMRKPLLPALCSHFICDRFGCSRGGGFRKSNQTASVGYDRLHLIHVELLDMEKRVIEKL